MRERSDSPRRATVLAMPDERPVETITPRELAEDLGVSDRAVRQWLWDQGWQSVAYTRWHLTPEQAVQVREHFGG